MHSIKSSEMKPLARNMESPGLAEVVAKLLGELGPMATRDIRHELLTAGLGDIPQRIIKQAIRTHLGDAVVRRGEQWGVCGDSRFGAVTPPRYARGRG